MPFVLVAQSISHLVRWNCVKNTELVARDYSQTTSFYPQFLTYLQTGKPQYIFNYHSTKGESINAVKGEFLRLFQSNKMDDIWDNGQEYFISKGIGNIQALISDLNTKGVGSKAFDFIQ